MTHYKRLFLVGLPGYAFALIFSVTFFQERTIFGDIAFHLFEIISKGSFAIQNYRFGAVATQVFPMIGLKLSLPLSSIMMLYSCGYIIYYLVCYCLCGFWLKQYKWALVLLFVNMLFVAHTFYWIQSELPQALALMCVFFATLAAYPEGRVASVIQWLLLVILAFFHPILPVAFFYVIAFLWLSKELATRKAITTCCVFGVAYLVKTLLFKSRYDHGSMGAIKNFGKLFPNYFDVYANHRLLQLIPTHYYWIAITVVLVIYWYMRRKQWLKLLLFAGAFFGYLLLIQISFPGDVTADCIRENLYLPLAIVIAIPVIWDLFEGVQRKNVSIVFMILIVGSFLARILYTRPTYAVRLHLLTDFVDKHRGDKLIAPPSYAHMQGLPLIWASPYETWLASTSRYGATASIVLTDSIKNYESMTSEKDIFITTWGYSKYKDLPARYFILKDTTDSYYIIR